MSRPLADGSWQLAKKLKELAAGYWSLAPGNRSIAFSQQREARGPIC
jgi:hypothetical protein